MKPLVLLVSIAFAGAALGLINDGPGSEAHLPSQAAADVIRDFAGTDGAFLAAGLVKETYQAENLASLLQYPVDEVAIVSLKGAMIKQALERSVSLYPQQNSSFLQLSGFEVVFAKNGPPGQRLVSVTVNGMKLDEGQTYTVAMPVSLARGGLGYFKFWDKAKITKTFDQTVEDVLKGKRYSETSPRWTAQ